jgi:lysophospholipase L1-like esterase
LDQKGLIWLVWSGYDGQDYEIFCRFWDGKKWADEISVTNNSQKNDVFPSVAVVSNDIPIVVWAQSEKDGSHIFIKFLENDSWSEEIKISSNKGRNVFPKMAVDGDKIGIIWQCQNEIKAKIFTFDYLRNLNKKGESLSAGQSRAKKQYNASLDEDKYIGYGDSITYGYIHYEPAPEKGYLPRLKVMLDQNFGETKVVNEGEPAEYTPEGLSRIDGVLEKHLARFLLLMEGTNDIIDINTSMETTAFNLIEMVKKCLKMGVVPAIATIIPRDDERWDNEFFRDRIFDLNQKIKDLAEEFPIPFIDQFNLFYRHPEQEGGWRSLLSDYNHPNEKGYQIMAEGWFEEIKNFPFPPVNVQIERRDAGDIFILPTLLPKPIDTQYPNIPFSRPKMNRITWLDNSKIFDKSTVQGYRIYRKKEGEGDDKFQLIKEIYEKFEYYDKEIVISEHYIYRVSTLRNDGVEGPCSESKKDH